MTAADWGAALDTAHARSEGVILSVTDQRGTVSESNVGQHTSGVAPFARWYDEACSRSGTGYAGLLPSLF